MAEACSSWSGIHDGRVDLSPAEVASLLAAGEPVDLLDVRELHELERSRIGRARHAPLSRLGVEPLALDPGRTTVVLCHHGARSAWLVSELRRRGFGRVFNLAGGIDAWAVAVDPTVGRY